MTQYRVTFEVLLPEEFDTAPVGNLLSLGYEKLFRSGMGHPDIRVSVEKKVERWETILSGYTTKEDSK